MKKKYAFSILVLLALSALTFWCFFLKASQETSGTADSFAAAETAFLSGNMELAGNLLSEFLTLDPNNEKALEMLASVLESEEKPELAEKVRSRIRMLRTGGSSDD